MDMPETGNNTVGNKNIPLFENIRIVNEEEHLRGHGDDITQHLGVEQQISTGR